MSKSTETTIAPGEWHADTESHFDSVEEAVGWFRGIYAATGSLDVFGVVAGWPEDPVVVALTGNVPRAAAHARFIAAAPKLLAACEAALAAVDWTEFDDRTEVGQQLRAAIHAATPAPVQP